MLALMALMAAITAAMLAATSLCRSAPLTYLIIIILILYGSAALTRNRRYLPFFREMRLQGRMNMAPLLLLLLSLPAALIYIYYDLSGSEPMLLLSELFASVAAAIFLSVAAVSTLPAIVTAASFGEITGMPPVCGKAGRLTNITVVAALVMMLLLTGTVIAAGLEIYRLIWVLPVAALVMLMLSVIAGADYSAQMKSLLAARWHNRPEAASSLITGNGDFPAAADDDPVVRRQAADAYMAAICSEEPDFSRSAPHRDTGRSAPGADGAGTGAGDAREGSEGDGLLGRLITGDRYTGITTDKFHEQDILRLLGSPRPEERRAAIIAAGRGMMISLCSEVIRALASPETAREAYHTLKRFGPAVYGSHIGAAVRAENSETENYIILRLLEAMSLEEALPWLGSFMAAGQMGVRLKAARSLCDRGWTPVGKARQATIELLDEAVHTAARLIALGQEATRGRHFLIAAAIGRERKVNRGLISVLIALVAGQRAAVIMVPQTETISRWQAEVSAEMIEELMPRPVRRSLRALLGSNSDSERLAELSVCFPLRDVGERPLTSLLLASEQNITGTWTKACALHAAAEERRGLDTEQALSYLFSNSQLLQEESARAIERIDPGRYRATEARLPAAVRERISAIIGGKLPRPAMTFEKTRFLSLCFKMIPEEKIIMLASAMKYSESVDAEDNPNKLSWIVPSATGKTGLYTLSLNDVSDYLFYYPEYTEILINYVDNQVGVNIT